MLSAVRRQLTVTLLGIFVELVAIWARRCRSIRQYRQTLVAAFNIMAYLRFHVAFDVGAFAFIDVLTFARIFIFCVARRAITAKTVVKIGNFNPAKQTRILTRYWWQPLRCCFHRFRRFHSIFSHTIVCHLSDDSRIHIYTVPVSLPYLHKFARTILTSCCKDPLKIGKIIFSENHITSGIISTHCRPTERWCRRWFSFRCNNNWTNRQRVSRTAIPLSTIPAWHRV